MSARPDNADFRKGQKKSEAPMRRSNRINGQVKPSPHLIAAKQKARQAAKKQQNQMEVIVRDIYQTAQEAKELRRGATGLVYDDRMTEHRCLWDPNYQECPERFTCVIERCKELGLLERCQPIVSREASEDEVLRLHSQDHLDRLKGTEGSLDVDNLEKLASNYDAIFIHPATYRLSLLSVGSTIELVEQIVKGHTQNGMAIIRPPGHHAMKSEYCGYCYFNNVALAADHAIHKLGLSRILIVDWDVHHGQATQQMFYSDPRVLYFSIHRYEHGSFWPNLRESDYDFVGQDEGVGFNFNIPLNKVAMQDADYMAIFHQVLLPVATEYQPELIIISSGYDAAIGCPEGEMEVTPACYAHLLSSLMGLAGGKVAVVLEGGYYLKSLAEGAALTLRTLLGDPCPNIGSLVTISDSIAASILNAIYSHREYWKCFQFQDTFNATEPVGGESGCGPRHVPEVTFNYSEPKLTVHPTRDCYPRRSADVVVRYDNAMNRLIAETKLVNPVHKVCLVYDSLMMFHRDEFDNSHPEKPERISAIYEMLEEYNLLTRLHAIQSRIATEDELLLIHSAEHVARMKAIAGLPEESHANEKAWSAATNQRSYHSVYLHSKSFASAALAAGSLLQVVDSVVTGVSGSGVAVVRPPGHHAELSEPCGFCIFNNVALAAKYAIEKYNLSRILVLDWDVHHGNGIQHAFEDDARVLYVSLHRYDNGTFFPGSTDAAATVVGKGSGRGFNVNIPWNKRGMGTAEYVAAFHQVVLPIAYQFNPQLVLISAGFDAAVGDPLGGCRLPPEAYAHLTHWLMPLARGRVIVALEGGYNVRSISYAMTMCTKALLGDPLPPIDPSLGPCQSAVDSIKHVLQVQSEFWQVKQFVKALPKALPVSGSRTEQKAVEECSGLFPSSNATDDMKAASRQQQGVEQGGDFAATDAGHLRHYLECSSESQDLSFTSNETTTSSLNELRTTESALSDVLDKFQGMTMCEGTVVSDTNETSANDKAGGSSSSGPPPPQPPQPPPDANKQTLVDYLSENMHLLATEQMFAVVPLPGCPHLPLVSPVPSDAIQLTSPCTECTSSEENWICLTCYTVHCSRFVNGHMATHWDDVGHPLCLSFADLSVWCYACDAYIDNPVLFSAKNAAHRSKFGSEMPWSYREPRPQ